MGKLAENERLKLEATYWNNLAVAATAATLIIPTVQLIVIPVSGGQAWRALAVLAFGGALSWFCRWIRDKRIMEVQD